MISPDTIAAVKSRTDLVALVAGQVRLVRRGRALVGLCPFHQEKTPSFHVNPDRGFFHCFGCKVSGGPVDFVMLADGLTFPEAVADLAGRLGIEVEDTRTDDQRREATAAQRTREDLYSVNAAAAVFFERQLHGSRAHVLARYAREELARRGIALPDGENAASQFRLGYAPVGWDGLTKYLAQQGISMTAAERVGLIVPRSQGGGHYDRFRHRLMFPVVDVNGRIVAFSGRTLPIPTDAEMAGQGLAAPPPVTASAPPKYVNSPESPIYTKGQHLFGLHQGRGPIRHAGEAVLVEGNFDVVGLHARGITTAVAPLGTAFTAEQAKLLRRFASGAVVLFDGDAAGRKATVASREPCRGAGLTVRVGAIPTGTDPDELARTKGAGAVLAVIGSAKGALEWSIDLAVTTAATDGTVDGHATGIEAVFAALREETDPTVREMGKVYARERIRRTLLAGAPAASLRQFDMGLARLSRVVQPPRQAVVADGAPALSGRAMGILGSLVDHPELLDDPDVAEALAVVDGDLALAVYRVSMHRAAIGEALAELPESCRSFVAARLASPQHEDAARARRALLDNARRARVIAEDDETEAKPTPEEQFRRLFAAMQAR